MNPQTHTNLSLTKVPKTFPGKKDNGSHQWCWENAIHMQKTASPCTCHFLQKSKWIRDENVTSRGRCCRALVKLPLGTPISHDGVPGTASCLLFPSSFLLTITLGGSRWWLRYLVPCHAQGRPGLNSWLWPGRCLAIAGI